jgi:hypothetical protein
MAGCRSTKHDDAHLSLLVWAAGSPVAATPGAEALCRRACSLLRYHGLVGRLLERGSAEAPALLDAPAAKGLAALHAEDRRRTLGHVRDVCAALQPHPTGDRTPIVLKGITAAALFGNLWLLRGSADVDLLAPSAKELSRRLGAAGFRRLGYAAQHEEANLTNGDTVVDAHTYYPVYGAVPGLDQPLPRGLLRPVRPAVPLHQCSFEDLDGLAEDRPFGDVGGVRFLTPTAAALVYCAHLANSFHLSAYPPKIRLGELRDALAMAEHPDFDAALFAELARRHHAEEAVGLANTYIAQLLGLPLLPAAAPATRPGRDLWWRDGKQPFAVDVPVETTCRDDVLRRVALHRVVEDLPQDPISPGQDVTLALDGLTRFASPCLPGGLEEAQLRCRWDDRLRITLHASASPAPLRGDLCVYVNAGGSSGGWQSEGGHELRCGLVDEDPMTPSDMDVLVSDGTLSVSLAPGIASAAQASGGLLLGIGGCGRQEDLWSLLVPLASRISG